MVVENFYRIVELTDSLPYMTYPEDYNSMYLQPAQRLSCSGETGSERDTRLWDTRSKTRIEQGVELLLFFSHGFWTQVLFLNSHWNKYVNLWKIFGYMPLKLSLEPPVIVMPHSGKHYHRELLEVPWGGRMSPLLVEQGSSVSQVSCLLLFIILWAPDLPAYWISSFLAGNTLLDL